MKGGIIVILLDLIAHDLQDMVKPFVIILGEREAQALRCGKRDGKKQDKDEEYYSLAHR
jgi:hypothetical protein